VVSNSLNSDSVSHPFIVLPCDAAHDTAFVYAPPAPQIGQAVFFTGTATGTLPIDYSWAFGDGGGAAGTNATYTYTTAGVYSVTLTAENCGGPDTAVQTITVAPPCAPVQIEAVTPTVAGCVVTFTAGLTGSAPFTYLWAFGDGITSTAALPTHTYTQTGTYSGTLDVWNCADAGHDGLAFTVQVECVAPTTWRVYLPVVYK